jgi:hypothetical protein
MAAAFLPWEKWIARLLHPLYVRLRRRWLEWRRDRLVARSKSWPELGGEIYRVVWDSSLPREQLLYSYSIDGNYFSGCSWHWFDRSNIRELRAGDRIVLRYNPLHPEESVFVRLKESPELTPMT